MIIPKGNTRDLLADLCHWVIINGTVEEIWSCQTSLSVGVLVHLHIALTTIVKLIEQGDGLGICIKKLLGGSPKRMHRLDPSCFRYKLQNYLKRIRYLFGCVPVKL